MLVIRQGLVYVLADDSGPDQLVPGRQRPGEVIGEMALLTGEPHVTTLVAHPPTDAFELSPARA